MAKAATAETQPEDEGIEAEDNAVAIADRHEVVMKTDGGIAYTTTAAVIPAKISLKNWSSGFGRIAYMRDMSRFWIGDLLIFGESQEKWGERYTQAINATGLDYQTLRNFTALSKKFAPDRRRPELTWTHHRAVAGIEMSAADLLLQRAIDEELSAQDLQGLVREAKDQAGDTVPANERPRTRQPDAADTELLAGEIEPDGYGEPPDDSNTYFVCGQEGCGAYYRTAAWHCDTCNRHFAIDVDKCPICDVEDTHVAAPSTNGVAHADIIAPSTSTPYPADFLNAVHAIAMGRVLDPADIIAETMAPDATLATGPALVDIRAAIDVLTVLAEAMEGGIVYDDSENQRRLREEADALDAALDDSPEAEDDSEPDDEGDEEEGDDGADEGREDGTDVVDTDDNAEPESEDQTAQVQALNAQRERAKRTRGAAGVPKPGSTPRRRRTT